jgi:zinc protease
MPDRTAAPPFVKTASFNLINPEVTDLPNGIQVFFVPGGSQEVMKIEFIFEAGRWYENKIAAAYFTSHLLPKGTKQKSSFDVARIFDQYGAHLEISPGLDFVSVSLYTLNKNFVPVLQLLMEVLSEPAFPKKEFDQTKAIFIQNLKVNNEKTSYVASQAFRKNLFGQKHPYGTEVDEKHVESLSVDDFKNHFETLLHSAKVFVSGKIEPANRELMVKSFQKLAGGKAPLQRAFQLAPGPSDEYVRKKESIQSSVRMGKRSVLRSDPHYVSILFITHILGGYFGSRLMKNIREEKGLTYGISASLHGLRHDSYLVIGADVNKENATLTFDEIRKELKKLRSESISADELETTRNHFIGSLQSEITTPFAHAEKIKTIILFNLRKDHYQNMIARIDTISPLEILNASEMYFHEDSLTQVAVG